MKRPVPFDGDYPPMTVTNVNRSVTYNGDGSTTVFAVADDGPIYFLQNTDLTVTLIQADGTEIPQVLITNYTVTGAGDPSGGSVTMLVAPASGEKLRIDRIVAILQPTIYPENTKFPAKTHERALDRLTMIDQQQQGEIDRAPKFSEKSGFKNVELPAPEDGKGIKFDAVTGNYVNTEFDPDKAQADSEAAKNAAEAAQAAAEDARDGAGAAQLAAEEAAQAAQEAASTIQLPTPVAETFLRRNGSNTEYEALSSQETVEALSFVGPDAGEIAKTVYLNLIETVRVSRWGVEPDETAANNTSRMLAAIAAKSNAEFVFRDGEYRFNDKLTIPNGAIAYLVGSGPEATRLLQSDLTKDLLEFNLNYAQGGGVRGLTIAGDVPFSQQGSSGVGLTIRNANDNFVCEDLDVTNFDNGIWIEGSFQARFERFRILHFANWGILYAPYTDAASEGAGNSWRSGKISNLGFAGPSPENSIGLWMRQGSGEFFETIDITATGRGVVVAPPSGSWARFLKFYSVLSDTSYYEGWTFDGTDAAVLNIMLNNCWAAGSGGGANRPAGSTRGAGLLTRGANLDDFVWMGGELRDNDVHGWDHQGGRNCRLVGASVTRNSRRLGFNNTYYGVHVASGVSEWGILGCSIGNFSEGVFAVSQHHNIAVESGASQNFRIIGNDLRNPGSGGLSLVNGSSSVNNIIRDNLPLQTEGVNRDTGRAYSNTVGTIASAGATLYLGPNGVQAVEADTLYVVDRPGIVTQLIVQVTAAPGASQSFTYTLRKNGADTAITGQITGAGTFQIILAGGVAVSGADTLSLKLVGSAGAAEASHRWAITIDS